jgi:selenocysteine-specific elongation factor
MIIGTAGHIDHGKTALVRALTGVDTDRLPEEKRRGITIELGFAPLDLEGVGRVSIVDVPGHEAFVRTMVAGATGIDLALLVIAADEGVMPQTKEHLAILDLLGIRGGVVALSKCDLVDAEWLALLGAEIEALLHGTVLEGAAVVPTSAVSGAGLEELRQALSLAAASVQQRPLEDLFRMPVDRVFSVRGTGTVVTGTVWSGQVSLGQTLAVHPGGRHCRVRGVQRHGAAVQSAAAGSRAALALSGIEVGELERGAWLLSEGAYYPASVLRAEVSLLREADHPLRPREWVQFHLGTSAVPGRVVAAGGPIAPGERRPARVVLAQPVPARAGDRFVLRLPSPANTIGGGVVLDPLLRERRAKLWPLGTHAPGARLRLMVEESGAAGLAVRVLPVRLGVPPGAVAEILQACADLVVLGEAIYARSELENLTRRLLEAVDQYHLEQPLADGIPISRLRSLTSSDQLFAAALEGLQKSGTLVLRDGLAARAGWQPQLDVRAQATRDRLLGILKAAGSEPPDIDALSNELSMDVRPLLKVLAREGSVVEVESTRYYAAEVVQALVRKLRSGMTKGRSYTPSQLRELLGMSRKYLIPFLEYCDRARITERREEGRKIL